MKTKTIIAAIAALALVLGAVVVASEDTSAETYTVTVEDPNGGDVQVADSVITGVVKNGSVPDTPEYSLKITVASGAGTFVTYVDYEGEVQSVEASEAGKAVVTIQIDEDTEAFVFAVTAIEQTSMVGLATNTVAIDVDFNDGSPSSITWKADGISIATTSTDAPEMPAAPSKAHYTFMGWAIDGTVVITYNAGLEASTGDGYVLTEALVTDTITTPDEYLAAITEDTVIEASFTPVIYTVTLMAGDAKVGEISAAYGTTVVEPRLPEGFKAWDYDFSTPITGDITIVAIEADPIAPVTTYNVTFQIEGKADVIQKSDSLVVPDTTREGYAFQGWVVKGGAEYVDPTTYAITQDITFVAVYKTATETTYTVTFEIEGKANVIQKADSLAIPDTTREGYIFQGWVVKGSSAYVDPLTYQITSDVTFTAVYRAVEVVEHTVTFVNGSEVIGTVKVVDGEKITTTPEAPEGLFWLYDKDAAVTEDITIEAKPINVKVEFKVGDKVFAAYTQIVPYGESLDTDALSDFVFPEGFDSWDADLTAHVYEDTVIVAKAIPAPVEEPGFFHTPMGQCAIILAVFVIGALFAVAYTKGLIKVPSRKAKTEVPAAPAEPVKTEAVKTEPVQKKEEKR